MFTLATQSSGALERVRSATASLFARREASVIVGLISIYVLGLIAEPSSFLTIGKFSQVLTLAAPNAIMGYSVALLMITAEFDLSVGSLFGVAGAMVVVMIISVGLSGPVAILVALVVAGLYGVSQGLLVTQLNLPSLIVSIGTLTGLRGVVQIILGSRTRPIAQEQKGFLTWLGGKVRLDDVLLHNVNPWIDEGFAITYQIPGIHDGMRSFDGFSIMIVWAFILLGLFHYLLFYTRFGHHVRATGDNIQSAGTTGVDPEIVKIVCFGIVGVTSAFAGIAYVTFSGSAGLNTGNGRALFVIAAVVLGGTKLTGGEGSMVGALLGAVVLQLANNVLFSLGMGFSGWTDIITGGFIVAAVGLDVVFRGFSVDLIRGWYLTPTRKLVGSPAEFFRTESIRKTSSDMYGYLMVSIGATAILTNLLALVIGLRTDLFGLLDFLGVGEISVPSLLGLNLSGFKLVVNGNWPETVLQVYLFLLLIATVSFFVVEIVTPMFDRGGDYENSLAIATYSTAVAPLLSVPIVMYGFDIFFVGGELISSLIVAIPIFLVMLWLIYTGVSELHELSPRESIATVGALVGVWLVISAIVSWSLTNVQPVG